MSTEEQLVLSIRDLSWGQSRTVASKSARSSAMAWSIPWPSYKRNPVLSEYLEIPVHECSLGKRTSRVS